MGNPNGGEVRGEEEKETRRKLKGKEKMDDEGTSEARRIKISRVDENIEEKQLRGGNGVGTCFMPVYLPSSSSSSTSEVVDRINDEDKLVKKRPKIDGNSNGSKPAVGNGVDPEPCHHGWVGALGNLRGASAPTWVCSKNLTPTDLDPSQSRLLLPKASMEKFVREFLTERERSELSRRGDGSGGLAAVIVDEMGRCWETRLNLWASRSYNLNGRAWRRMVSRYELSEQYAAKIGAFRYYASAGDDGHGHGEEEKSLGFVLLVQRNICKK